jgi:hypothetical protein
MIFPCDYAYTYQFVVFKNVKSVLKIKNEKMKKVLTPRGMALGACCRGAGRQGPGTVPHGPAAISALLPPCPMAAGT